MYNKVILIGRLTADVELKQTQSGISVASFSIACNKPYNKDKEREADFINCVAWRNTAEFISKYFGKGNAIGIDGSIQTRKYTDKNGNNRTATEVLVNSAFFVESKASQSTKQNVSQTNVGVKNASNGTLSGFEELATLDNDDDLPF